MAEVAIIAATAVSVGASLKQAQLSKKASKIQQQQIEEEKAWGKKQAAIDKENLNFRKRNGCWSKLSKCSIFRI